MSKSHLLLLISIGLSLLNASAKENVKNTSANMSSHAAISSISSTFVTPKRIVWTSGAGVSNAEVLLKEYAGQITTSTKNVCVLSSKNGETAALLLDFGKELHGSVEISAAMRSPNKPVKVRIRLGESVSEAMSNVGGLSPDSSATNDHAMRDMVVELPWLGVANTNNSGFRFVRIDLLEPETNLALKAIRIESKMRDIPYLGSFECDNERLNKIWNVGAYTVHLNMQEYLWDGIKRDRLVWLGDMHPEMMTINTVFGQNDVVKKSLDFGRDSTPLPEWMNGMTTYSMWWLMIHRDLYMYQGDYEYLIEQKDYANRLIHQIIDKIDGNKETFVQGRFVDWPTSENKEVTHAGLQALTIMTMEAGIQLAEWMKDPQMKADCENALARLRNYTPAHMNNKQAASLQVLAGMVDAEKTSKEVLLAGGANGFSTFIGYYMLNAIAQSGDYAEGMKIISDYWGAMLDLGATSFWENLDYNQIGNAARIDEIVPVGKYDIHAQGGAYCYVGLRNSLCHGWASGPTTWLSQYVLGVTPIEPGFKKVKIEPHLGDLQWVKGTFPTPMGLIKIEHTKDKNGKVKSKIKAPKGVKVVLQ